MKKDRFDLESALMEAWHTSEDINLVFHSTDNLDIAGGDLDVLQNQLLGLKSLSDLRMARLWSVFEELIKQGDIK
tara:strand:- start:226 stop:450 length:225 start_codon:yes stop_codon:yes gene_type:complete